MIDDHEHIVLFDEVCNLCSGWVQFLRKRDPNANFSFYSVQSGIGKALLNTIGLSTDQIETILADDHSLLLIDKPIHGDMRIEFVALFKTRQHEIARLFDVDVNRDIDTSPISQLSKVVKLIGLKLETVQQKKENGKKLYFYAIPQVSINKLSKHLTRRKDPDIRYQWHTDRGNETENILFADADSDQQEVFYYAKTAIKEFQKDDDTSNLNFLFEQAEPDIPWVTF